MTWFYQDKEVTEIPEDSIGFVYLITNLTNDRKYIGKKLAQFKRSRKPLKGEQTSVDTQLKVIGKNITAVVMHYQQM